MFYRVTVMLQTQSRVVRNRVISTPSRQGSHAAREWRTLEKQGQKSKRRRVATESINTLREKKRRIPRSKQITSNAQLIVVHQLKRPAP
jgi:hypothetical protein